MNCCKVCKDKLNRKNQVEKILGLPFSEYEKMQIEQNNCCYLCNLPCRTGEKLSIDHCHKTGKVRGLLCRTCNSALGLFNDDPALLRRAADYIDRA